MRKAKISCWLIYKHNLGVFYKEYWIFKWYKWRYVWQQDNNTKESKVFEATKGDRKGVSQVELQGGHHKGLYPKGYTAIHSLENQDMDRMVLSGIPEEGGGAGKQGMVLPYG